MNASQMPPGWVPTQGITEPLVRRLCTMPDYPNGISRPLSDLIPLLGDNAARGFRRAIATILLLAGEGQLAADFAFMEYGKMFQKLEEEMFADSICWFAIRAGIGMDVENTFFPSWRQPEKRDHGAREFSIYKIMPAASPAFATPDSAASAALAAPPTTIKVPEHGTREIVAAPDSATYTIGGQKVAIYDDASNAPAVAAPAVAAPAVAAPAVAAPAVAAPAVAAPAVTTPNADNNTTPKFPGDETLLYKDGETAKEILKAGRYRSSKSTTALLSELRVGMDEINVRTFLRCLRPLLDAHDKRCANGTEDILFGPYFSATMHGDSIHDGLERSDMPDVFIYHALRGGLKEGTLELAKIEAFTGAQELVDSVFPGWKS